MRRFGSKKLLAAGIMLVVGLLGFGGCWLWVRGDAPPRSSGAEPIMIVRYEGGLCASGQGCESEYALLDDGTFEGRQAVTADKVAELRAVIDDTDFLKYPPNPQPNCPSYTDGADEILSFPGKYPGKSFRLCELQIPADDSAIRFISDLLEVHPADDY